MKSKFWALLVGALLHLSTPAFAQQCAPVQPALIQLELGVGSDIKSIIQLDDAQQRRVIAWINAQPPVTTHEFELAFVVMHEDGTLTAVAVNGGEVCGGAIANTEESAKALLAAIEGEPA